MIHAVPYDSLPFESTAWPGELRTADLPAVPSGPLGLCFADAINSISGDYILFLSKGILNYSFQSAFKLKPV